MIAMKEPLLFAPVATREFGERVACAVGCGLAPLEEREFEGGEHKMRPLVDVRGRDAYVFQSLSGDAAGSANDRLCRMLFLVACLHDAGAASVTACVPYLCYGRKDRRTKDHDPVTLRYVAQLIEAVGTSRVIALDAHNLAAFENAFRIPVDHLEAAPLLARYLAESLEPGPLCVVSPDFGGAKRAQRLQELLAVHAGCEVAFAVHEKRRSSGKVSGSSLFGSVRGANAVIVDDLISAGDTILRAVQACRDGGARSVTAFATHGVLVPEARRLLGPGGPDTLIVSDSILPTRLEPGPGERAPVVLAVSALYGQAICRIAEGASVIGLRELEPGKR
jgi:ribose-phosphate pyrophosphokinase